jgi:hypothetical protein
MFNSMVFSAYGGLIRTHCKSRSTYTKLDRIVAQVAGARCRGQRVHTSGLLVNSLSLNYLALLF